MACQIDFTPEKYQNLPFTARDLLIKMIQKDPKDRVTASDALNHPFFNSEQKNNTIATLHPEMSLSSI